MGFISASGTGFAAPTGGSAGSLNRFGRRLGAAMIIVSMLGGAAPAGSLKVSFEQLRSAKGSLRICLTRDPDNFPRCVDDAAAIKAVVKAADGVARYDALASGSYALAVIHDENDNRKLDTALGIPSEGVGFSRNPRLGFGPPRFESARFELRSGDAAQSVRMKYFL